jgi:chemotaxis response regulator CheB
MRTNKGIVYVTRSGRALTGEEIEVLVAQAEVNELELADRFPPGRTEPDADSRLAARAINQQYQALILEGMDDDVAVRIIGMMLANAAAAFEQGE